MTHEVTTLRTAAQQALEALENLQPIIGNGLLNKIQLAFIDPNLDVAITALRAALAEPVQEPVATLIAQRDALLEALKYVDKELSKHGRKHWPEAVNARAAIKAVEETK